MGSFEHGQTAFSLRTQHGSSAREEWRKPRRWWASVQMDGSIKRPGIDVHIVLLSRRYLNAGGTSGV
jgi:hypothetical protein